MSKRKSILKHTGIYSAGTQVAQLITLLAAVFSRRFLGPTQTGIWAALQVLVDYSKYSTLGTMDAVSQEIPYRLGKGEGAAAEKTKNLAATFVFSGSIVFALLISLFSFLSQGRFSQEVTHGFYLVAIVIFLQRINNLLIAILRCYKQFAVETEMMIISATVNAGLVGFLSYFYKIYGFIWATILSLLFNIGFMFFRYKFSFSWNFDLKALKPLVGFGFPLMLLGLAMTLFRSIDRILLARYLGFESLGWYSIALMATSYISNFPNSIQIVMMPYFQEKYGEKDSPQDLRVYVLKSTHAVALVMPMLLALIALVTPWAVHFFLPQFLPGILSMKILVSSMFFISLAQLFHASLITIKKHMIIFPVLLGASAVTAGLDFWAISAGQGIVGVAMGTAGGIFLYFLSIYIAAAVCFSDLKPAFVKLPGIIFLFLYLAAFLWITHVYSAFFYQAAGFVLFCLPLLIAVNQQFHLWALVRAKFFPKAVQ